MKQGTQNPFRPGAGQKPPYLAGRVQEREEFRKLLWQDVILENLTLTGLRGIGKTVLLETFKPTAIEDGWAWIGADLSESTSVSEASLATRILADMSLVTSDIVINRKLATGIGFTPKTTSVDTRLTYRYLTGLFDSYPGLFSDKLKGALEFVWAHIKEKRGFRGVIFAYDEAQNISDHSDKEQYPLSMLLDVFQSIQKKGVPFMLVLVGLPTLFPKLVETRTYSERMFRVVILERLNDQESRDAIIKPIQAMKSSVVFNQESIRLIIKESGGYPYFIQFICREAYDVFFQKGFRGEKNPSIPLNEIVAKLDTDFFAGRWARVTDRQRELLSVIAELENCDEEFTVAEVVEKAKISLSKPLSSSHVNQMLSALIGAGLIYKNRYGKYSFAVPLLGRYIRRQKVRHSR